MAAGLKVPSSLCFSLNGYADKHQLTFKALGNLPASNGKVKMYSINGFVNGAGNYPVHGTGFVYPGTTTLHATYIAQGANTIIFSYELKYDLATNTGPLYAHFHYSNSSQWISSEISVASTDCTLLPVIEETSAARVGKVLGE
jgi:hypothetical protein